MLKLRGKTYFLIIPLITLPLLLLGWVSYVQLTSTTEKIIIDEMHSSSEQIKSQYQLHLKTILSNIELFSNHNTVEEYAVSEDPDTRYTLLQLPLMQQFSRYTKSFPGYYEFRFIYPNGDEDTRWTKTRLKNIDENEKNNHQFQKAITNKENIYYSIFKNQDNSLPALWVSKRIIMRDRTKAPVTKEPTLRGYFVITSNLNFIKNVLNKTRIGDNGFFIIVNEKAELLSFPSFKSNSQFFSKTYETYETFDFGGTNWATVKNSPQPIKTELKNNLNFIVNSTTLDKNIYLVSILPESEFSAGSKAIKDAVALITLFSIIISSLLILYVLRKIIITPINELNIATAKISMGHLNTKINIKSKDEIGELADSFNNMTDNLKESTDQIKYLAYHDNLTGLPNRLMFKEYLEPILGRAKRNNEIFAILFLDLDDFKRVNDSLGHKAGDKLLQNIAAKLSTCIRNNDFISHKEEKIDSASNIVARLGGDEFIILLTDIDKADSAAIIADRILHEFKAPEKIDNHELYVSTSIGISVYPNDGDTADLLMKNADLAMYNAKEAGKNVYSHYSSALNKSAKLRLNMENKLRKAVDNGDFILHYQPQINLHTNKINGVEALIRWNDPEQGMIPPNDFISIAEENGLIQNITEWVLYESCKQNKAWQDADLPLITVSANISGVDIARGDLYSLIKKTINSTKLEAEYLEVELTESVMMSNNMDVVTTLRKIKDTGASIALDDFGTGYSSLNYLLRFPIHTLKIDRSFIIDIEHNTTKSAITSSIIEMAHTLDLKVVAEGIEKEEQLNILKYHNCDIIQGYYFSKPVESQVIESMLLKEKNKP